MLSIKVVLVLVSTCFWGVLFCQGQDPQNMKVGNTKINCEKIEQEFKNLQEAKISLDTTTFTFTQEYKTTKKFGVMEANFYTCDNATGFLRIVVSGKEQIFRDVTHFTWKGLLETNDPDQFFEDHIRDKFTSAINNKK